MSRSWRDVLPVHPAADLFPMLPPDELQALGKDIKKNGLRVPIVLWAEKLGADFYLLDGRNRLDAMEATGQEVAFDRHGAPEVTGCLLYGETDDYDRSYGHKSSDPVAAVLSLNISRRHLTAEQKREVIAKVLKAKPGASNRQIAAQVKSDDKTVGKIRKELEATAEIPRLTKTTGKDGKARTTAPKPRTIKPKAEPKPKSPKPKPEPKSHAIGIGCQTHPNVVSEPKPEQMTLANQVFETLFTFTVEDVKEGLIRFDDDELEDLRRAIDAELDERKNIGARG
jgi:hypothetical protein